MIATLLLAAAAAAAATPMVDTAELDAQAAAFAGQPLGAVGGPLAPIDARLRLARCGQEPVLDWRSARRDAIVIQCPDTGGWRLFVAVRMAPATAPVPVGAANPAAARPQPVIRRGEPVSLVAGAAGFTVTSDGVAMGDAAEGGRLLIRIAGRPQPVAAIAIEPGRATIPAR